MDIAQTNLLALLAVLRVIVHQPIAAVFLAYVQMEQPA
jgi:hypothetical protein